MSPDLKRTIRGEGAPAVPNDLNDLQRIASKIASLGEDVLGYAENTPQGHAQTALHAAAHHITKAVELLDALLSEVDD